MKLSSENPQFLYSLLVFASVPLIIQKTPVTDVSMCSYIFCTFFLKWFIDNDKIGNLQERLAKDIANESKSESSRFIEYWVPVLISSVQLEQYGTTLLENSLSLCSPLRSDPIGALRKTLISTRKVGFSRLVFNYTIMWHLNAN